MARDKRLGTEESGLNERMCAAARMRANASIPRELARCHTAHVQATLIRYYLRHADALRLGVITRYKLSNRLRKLDTLLRVGGGSIITGSCGAQRREGYRLRGKLLRAVLDALRNV